MSEARLQVPPADDQCVAERPEGIERAAEGSELLVTLAARAGAGDRAALEALAAALYPVVRRSLGRFLRRETTADLDDATQDAMARIAARVAQCAAPDDRGVRAWARTVAWRVALEELRSGAARVARRSLPLADGDHDPTWGRAFADELPEPDALDALDAGTAARDRLARAAVHALDRLPAPIAELFWMRLVGDASWPDAARALGTTTAAVKRRFQRAQATLRRHLGAPPGR